MIGLVLGLAGCHHGLPVPAGDIAASLAHTPRVEGGAFDPASLAGKPAIVAFVSPTCSHCLATLPRAAAAAKAQGANLVSVFVVGQASNASGVVAHLHLTGPTLIDDGTLRERYKIHAVPYLVVLGPDGHARAAYLGEQDEATLAGALADAR